MLLPGVVLWLPAIQGAIAVKALDTVVCFWDWVVGPASAGQFLGCTLPATLPIMRPCIPKRRQTGLEQWATHGVLLLVLFVANTLCDGDVQRPAAIRDQDQMLPNGIVVRFPAVDVFAAEKARDVIAASGSWLVVEACVGELGQVNKEYEGHRLPNLRLRGMATHAAMRPSSASFSWPMRRVACEVAGILERSRGDLQRSRLPL